MVVLTTDPSMQKKKINKWTVRESEGTKRQGKRGKREMGKRRGKQLEGVFMQ